MEPLSFRLQHEKSSAFSIPISTNRLIALAFISSITLQIIVMEVSFMSKFLKTVSVPVLDMIYLFLIGLIVLLFMEIYKRINKKRI